MLHLSDPPDAFDREWQDYLNGQVIARTWSRGIIPQHNLSLVNLAMLVGLGRMEDFENQFRTALLENGVPLIQLREVLMHIVLYCGAPMARDCFAIARKVLKEEAVDLSVLNAEGATA